MSLINEALKKAQNMQARAPAAAPASAAAPTAAPKLKTKAAQVVPPPFVPTTARASTPSVHRRSPGGSKTVLAIGAGLFVVALGVLGFAMFVLFGKSKDSSTVAASSTETASDTSVATAPASTEPATPASTDASASSESPAAPETGVEQLASAPTAPAVPPPPLKKINRPNAKIQDFVNKITVSGIRSGERARALMNDRVYAIGDLVNADLDLHLTSISQDVLEFEDAEGNTYTLHF